MKETLESIDKLQVDLDEANAAKVTIEARVKTVEDQVANLQRQLHLKCKKVEPYQTRLRS